MVDDKSDGLTFLIVCMKRKCLWQLLMFKFQNYVF